MTELFIRIGFLDIIDVVLVAFLLYELYRLMKGTVAFNISMGIFIVYIIWLVVKALNMQLVGTILGQLFGVGVLALIVVFQQEIRKFLILLGTRYSRGKGNFSIEKFFPNQVGATSKSSLRNIIDAVSYMATTKTGALIVIEHDARLEEYSDTGKEINAEISSELLRSIFFKNSPLHDGAAIISGNKIKAVRCILPISSRHILNPAWGLRHRAAIGMSEETDAYVIVVSEETGNISMIHKGTTHENITGSDLFKILEAVYSR